jgi:monoamine oxidase
LSTARPAFYIDHNWSEEEWTRGDYAAFLPPGVFTGYGPEIRKPVGRIHWAGTETATEWNVYMDGAVQSGERTAAEVLSAEGWQVNVNEKQLEDVHP